MLIQLLAIGWTNTTMLYVTRVLIAICHQNMHVSKHQSQRMVHFKSLFLILIRLNLLQMGKLVLPHHQIVYVISHSPKLRFRVLFLILIQGNWMRILSQTSSRTSQMFPLLEDGAGFVENEMLLLFCFLFLCIGNSTLLSCTHAFSPFVERVIYSDKNTCFIKFYYIVSLLPCKLNPKEKDRENFT